ncbi:MAG: hypothetical protein ABIG89_07480 [Candidatus Woesearchaeota archaeon]
MNNYRKLAELFNVSLMEETGKFYIGLGILVLLILGFIIFIGYNITQTDKYKNFQEYDMEYDKCVSLCTTPDFSETQEECEKKCLIDFEERKD